MTELEILRRACVKANIKYEPHTAYIFADRECTRTEEVLVGKDHYQIIFSHDFAKAFWGETMIEEENSQFYHFYDTALGAEYDWQVHIQQMVLEPEPLSYLAKFLEEDTL